MEGAAACSIRNRESRGSISKSSLVPDLPLVFSLCALTAQLSLTCLECVGNLLIEFLLAELVRGRRRRVRSIEVYAVSHVDVQLVLPVDHRRRLGRGRTSPSGTTAVL